MKKRLILSIFSVLFAFLVLYELTSDVSSHSVNRFLLSIHHKPLLPLDGDDFVGTVLVCLGLLIAASGGIGGGGILVPLFILVFGFGPKYAVALSNFCILATSITNMIMNLPKRHPSANRPLVDWDLILVMEPLTMGGAILGALASKLLPDWILVCSLVVLLAFTTWTTLEKGFSQYRSETKSFMAEVQEKIRSETERQPLLSREAEDEEVPVSAATRSIHDENIQNKSQLENILQSETQTPWDKVYSIIILVVVVTVLNLLKGGGGKFPSPIGIECGSFWYWVFTVAVFVWILYIALHMRADLIERWKLKKAIQYRYIEGDVEWNEWNTIKYPCICVFAGFFAGLFGIGGGIVKGPLMLWMGIHPQVASATVAVMIFFTSIAATTMYIAFGTLQWDYGLYFAVVGFFATSIGQFGVGYLVKKYKRISLISLSIGAVVAISTVLMSVQGIFSLIDASNGESQESNALCTNN